MRESVHAGASPRGKIDLIGESARRRARSLTRPIAGRRLLRALLAGVSLSFAVASTAHAESRVALVIGNGDYKNVPTLSNPPHDAQDVAQALSALGFKVRLLVDADRATFEKEVTEFGREAVASDVSLFYYGGHGLQVAGRNYLVPVNANLRHAEDIDTETVHLDAVLDAQKGGRGVHLIFLDACRDDPTRNAKTPIGGKGLARVGAGAGFYIGFATEPGNVALDGAGRNSPFADALLHHIAEPGLDVYNMMIQVRNDVAKATGNEQTPWDEFSLTRQFYFKGDAAAKAPPEARLGRSPPNSATAAWRRSTSTFSPRGRTRETSSRCCLRCRKRAPQTPRMRTTTGN